MTKPEKRWQLLLVADDGRIIPFKHIKGIALTLSIISVLLGLVCAGLGWQLNRERTRYRQTLDRLAFAKQEAARYKSENEVVNAELILADARMKKAGLPVPDRQPRTAQPDPTLPHDPSIAAADPDRKPAAENQKLDIKAKEPSVKPVPSQYQETGTTSHSPMKTAVANGPAVVAVGELVLKHDPAKGMLKATFRVNNNGPLSSAVAGSCMVVLKKDQADPITWRGLPGGALVDGKLDGKKGKVFKISRFIDMDMEAALGIDPSVFTTATVYVFDTAGAVLLERDFSISLPALRPAPEPSSLMAGQSGDDASMGGDAEASAVSLSGFKMAHDTAKSILRATFRVSNTGPRSSPIAGRCVVVLKKKQLDPDTWVAVPQGAMLVGQPNKAHGQPFKISRFRDMVVEAAVNADPSIFTRAVVVVFGLDGAVLLEKTYPIHLSAPLPTEDTPAAVRPSDDSRWGASPHR